MKRIQRITVDSTAAETHLCTLGSNYKTDKSPYNDAGHRHPYTAVYSLFLSQYRFQPVRFVEIGIAGGNSILLWRTYFTHKDTHIFGFDRDKNFIQNVLNFQLPGVSLGEMDVYEELSIRNGLQATGGNLDVILDDSSHGLVDQIRIIKQAIPFLKPGGVIIIEDIFRDTPEERYEEGLADVLDQFSMAMFVVTEHERRYSPGWNNDKLLFLVKK
jgi:predicted O-methyltransferase YrrM